MSQLNGVQRLGYTPSYQDPKDGAEGKNDKKDGNDILAGAAGLTVAGAFGGVGHIGFGVTESVDSQGNKIFRQFNRTYGQNGEQPKDYIAYLNRGKYLNRGNRGDEFYHIEGGKLRAFKKRQEGSPTLIEEFDEKGDLTLGGVKSENYSTATATGYKDIEGKEIKGYLHHVYHNDRILESPNFGTDIPETLIRKEVWDKNPTMQTEFGGLKPREVEKTVNGKKEKFIALARFSETANARLKQFGGLPEGLPKTFDEIPEHLKGIQKARTLQFLGLGAIPAILTYVAVKALTKEKEKES